MQLTREKQWYTYADYLEWDESVRAEIIGGTVYMMSPPRTNHQRVAGDFFFRLKGFLEGKKCEVFAAPFGVRLAPKADLSDDVVVEPDITVVCDPSKIDERGCNGAPDFIIEILSPSSKTHDKLLKFNLYLDAGVREYWIADPDEELVQVHILDNGRYITKVYGLYVPEKEEDRKYVSDTVPVSVLPGCSIDLKEIFRSGAGSDKE
jgi:Uma2 family endonuclease